MRKYAVIFQVAWRRALGYKGASFVFNTLFFINAFLNIAIWVVVLKSPTYRSEVTFSSLIMYYIVLIFAHQLIQSYTGGMIANEDIKHGNLSTYLLKPFPYLLFIYIIELPWRFVQFVFSIPIVIVLLYFFHTSLSLNANTILIGLLIFPLAYTLSFLIQVFIAQFSFWFDDATGFLNVIEVATLLFSGAGVPLFFFPDFLQKIAAWLPFQYAMFYPVATIANRLSPNVIFVNFMLLIIWVVVLAGLDAVLWKRGLQKFTGEGI